MPYISFLQWRYLQSVSSQKSILTYDTPSFFSLTSNHGKVQSLFMQRAVILNRQNTDLKRMFMLYFYAIIA